MSWNPANLGNTEDMYKAAFGEIPDGTIYDDGMMNIHKAVNVGAASGAEGFALTPVVWDREVIDITRKYTPLQTIIPKRANQGKTANYYRLTARGDATWQTETGALSEADDTRAEASKAIKYLRVTGKVTGVAQAAGIHFYNALQEEMMQKTQSMTMGIENALVNGTGAANQPEGLITMIGANNNDAVGGAVTIAAINDMLDECFADLGHVDLMVTDPFTLTTIKELLMTYVRYIDPVKIAWGADAIAFNSNHGAVPIIASQYMPTTTTERRLLAFDTRMVEQRVLVDVSYEDLAKTDDGVKFFLKSYRANINKFAEGCGQLSTLD